MMNSSTLASAFLEFRGWPYSRLHAVHLITMPVSLAGGVILAIGLVVLFGQPAKPGRPDSPDE
jgi:hypothetical protein